MQELIINNDVVRHAVRNNGYEPWLLPNSAFRFRLPWNTYGLGAIPIESGRVLWLNLFPMWVKCTLQSPFFEVCSQFFILHSNNTCLFLVHLKFIFTLRYFALLIWDRVYVL